MRKFLFINIITLFLSCISLFGQGGAPQDTSSNKLDKETINLIMQTFDGQEIALIKLKVDQLINSEADTLQKGFIASTLFDYYYNSKYMGYEEVALYIADNYFLNKKLDWPNEEGFMMLKMFAEFNRQSMIGMPAPELALCDTLGKEISVLDEKGRYKIIYFYDDQCSKCNLYTARLMKFIQSTECGPITLFRVYTQDSRERWTTYIKKLSKMFPEVGENVTIYDMWDPDLSSDFQKKYGVISTPQMFLLDENNIITGRKLDPAAVTQLVEMDYYKPTELELFIDQLFTSILPYDQTKEVDTTLVVATVDDLYNKSKSDTTQCKEMIMTMYQYLKSHSEYNLQKGAAYTGLKYIVGMPELWSDPNMVNETAKSVELFYRNQLGLPAQNLYLNMADKSSYSIYDSQGKYTVLYFYNMDCSLCEAVSPEMKKIYDKYHSKGVEFLGIYTGSSKERKKWTRYIASQQFEWVNLYDKNDTQEMFAKYNLSAVPAIYLLDEEKCTIAKDINPKTLDEILNYITND